MKVTATSIEISSFNTKENLGDGKTSTFIPEFPHCKFKSHATIPLVMKYKYTKMRGILYIFFKTKFFYIFLKTAF